MKKPKTHLFDKETPNYRACMARVDEMTEAQAKERLKWTLDALYGESDNDEPRRINANKEWDAETIQAVADHIDWLRPEKSDPEAQ